MEVIDKLFKQVHFIDVKYYLTAVEIATHFYNEI